MRRSTTAVIKPPPKPLPDAETNQSGSPVSALDPTNPKESAEIAAELNEPRSTVESTRSTLLKRKVGRPAKYGQAAVPLISSQSTVKKNAPPLTPIDKVNHEKMTKYYSPVLDPTSKNPGGAETAEEMDRTAELTADSDNQQESGEKTEENLANPE
jgi:hypothetical protein